MPRTPPSGFWMKCSFGESILDTAEGRKWMGHSTTGFFEISTLLVRTRIWQCPQSAGRGTGIVAVRCQPWRGTPGSRSTSHAICSGRMPSASSAQVGVWKPAAALQSAEGQRNKKPGCWASEACTMRAETAGCRCWTPKQSAQLDQNAGRDVKLALGNPRPPRDRGRLARSQ